MFSYNSKYVKVVLALLSGIIFSVFLVSYLIIHSIVRPKQAKKAHAQLIKRSWESRPGYKDMVVFTEDGVAIKGVVFERKNAQRIVLGCHGHRQSKESLASLVDLFPHDIIVLFDFRAHGESDGGFVSFGYHERKDIAAVVSFVKQRYQDKQLPLFGLGFSMGAASLIGAAADGVSFDGLVLNSSFSSLQNQISHVFGKETGLPHMPFMPVVTLLCPFLLGFELSDVTPACWVQSVFCPISIIHAVDDSYVLIESAHDLCANAYNLSDCWVMPKGGHNRALSLFPEEYQARCESLFSIS